VKIGALDDYELDPVQTENSQWMSLIDNLTVKAFAELTLAGTVLEGFSHLMFINILFTGKLCNGLVTRE
jgi:hypothetical protein